MSKTVLFLTIQFSISTQFSSVSPLDMNLSVATTLGQSGPGCKGIEGVLHKGNKGVTQSSSIIRPSSSDCLVSYPGHSLEESYLSAETQLVYSTDPGDRVILSGVT